jgi:ribosome-associated heat shock protein Hsp15
MSDMDSDGLRIDKWLWFTRFFKTRNLATAAVRGGHVRVNGTRPKAGARVRPGDRLEIVRQQLRFVVTVTGIPERRGPADEARACYTEDEAVREQREADIAKLKSDRMQMPTTPGRPDKHTRRALRSRNRRSGH